MTESVLPPPAWLPMSRLDVADWFAKKAAKLDPSLRGAYLVEQIGDEMGATLKHGDVAIVDTSQGLGQDGLYAIIEDGIEVVRRLQVVSSRPLRLMVITENPHVFYERLLRETKIIGRVIRMMNFCAPMESHARAG